MTVHQRLAPGKYRLNVDDYGLLGDAGAFGDARTELLDGEIVVMSPEWRPHGYVRDELTYRLRRALEDLDSNLFAGSGSVRLSDHEMPQPDIVLTSEPYGEGPIPLHSVALIIEVSSATLDRDSGQKARLYAASAIPEYWIADVGSRTLVQQWSPSAGGYGQQRRLPFGNAITAATVDRLTITLPDS